MPRFPMTTLTSVPLMRKPWAVSSLVSRNSIVSPGFTTIREGVKVKRSAVTRMTRRACVCAPFELAPAVASSATPSSRSRPMLFAFISKPPSQSNLEAVRRLHDAALIALPDVVGFDGDVRVRVIGDAHLEGVAIEFLERKKTSRPAELRVEVLVAQIRDQILGDAGGPDAIRRFALEATEPAGHVGRDAGNALDRVVQSGGVAD